MILYIPSYMCVVLQMSIIDTLKKNDFDFCLEDSFYVKSYLSRYAKTKEEKIMLYSFVLR